MSKSKKAKSLVSVVLASSLSFSTIAFAAQGAPAASLAYQNWAQVYNSASPAVTSDFSSYNSSNNASMKCSGVIAPATTQVSSTANIVYILQLSDNSVNGVIMTTSDVAERANFFSGNSDAAPLVKQDLAPYGSVVSKDTPQGLTITESLSASSGLCTLVWKKSQSQGILIASQNCAADATQNGLVACQTAPLYKAAKSSNGFYACFNVDANLDAFGSAVDSNHCASGNYAVAVDTNTSDTTNGSPMCFNIDSNGQAFGLPIEDSYCASGNYKIALAKSGTQFCFNLDSKGQVYGTTTKGSNCNGI